MINHGLMNQKQSFVIYIYIYIYILVELVAVRAADGPVGWRGGWGGGGSVVKYYGKKAYVLYGWPLLLLQRRIGVRAADGPGVRRGGGGCGLGKCGQILWEKGVCTLWIAPYYCFREELVAV